MLLLVHAAALAALIPLAWPSWIRLAIAAALIGGLVQALRQVALLRSADAVVAVLLRDDGTLQCLRRDGGQFDAEVLRSTAVHRMAVLLRVKVQGRHRARAIVVLGDSADAQALRRLRVWLRWKAKLSGA